MLELFPANAGLPQRSLLQDAGCGDIGESMRGGRIIRSEIAGLIAEQVQGSDCRPPQPKWNGMHGLVAD
ncbi:hypothetical protein ACFVUP_38510, partial [Streptomyces bacillaris]|uniref:hypothetical protein n=1 Tax=Streptomyces bacillaris TaxID=68179 RepID=UPI0036DCE7D9